MDKKITRLSDAELDIMLIIWSAENKVSASYILERLKAKRNWPLPALMTALSRLCEKEAICCEKQGHRNLYFAVLDEQEYKEGESRSFLEKLHDNSFMNMVTSLYNSKAIDNKDLSDLQQYLKRLQKGE